MRRRFIAAVWIAGATVPLAMAAMFVFGCCVLPFHQTIHKLMPACDMAADVMRGGHQHDAPQVPAQEKQESGPRAQIAKGRLPKLDATSGAPGLPRVAPAATASTAYRSFISLGATRCDQDVGLLVLVDTFRI